MMPDTQNVSGVIYAPHTKSSASLKICVRRTHNLGKPSSKLSEKENGLSPEKSQCCLDISDICMFVIPCFL